MRRRLLAWAARWRENAKTLVEYHERSAERDTAAMTAARAQAAHDRYAHHASARAQMWAIAIYHRKRWRRWDWLVEALGGDADFPRTGGV